MSKASRRKGAPPGWRPAVGDLVYVKGREPRRVLAVGDGPPETATVLVRDFCGVRGQTLLRNLQPDPADLTEDEVNRRLADNIKLRIAGMSIPYEEN